MKELPEKCACGKDMHMSFSKLMLYKSMENIWGEFKIVKIFGGKSYKVPVYFIILHGLKSAEVIKMGFEEVED